MILPSLVLMGIVLAGMSAITNKNQQGLIIAKSVDDARDQLKTLQNALKWCQVVYPAGDNQQTYAPGAESHVIFPASPSGGWMPARNMVCPGIPSKTIWAAAGELLPKPGTYLGEWQYKNDSTGIYFKVAVTPTGNQNGKAVLTQISSRLQSGQFNLLAAGNELEILHAP